MRPLTREANNVVITDQVKGIFVDARALYDDALEMLDQGRTRNAAEKAWGATKRATDALLLSRTGELPQTTALTSRGLLELADRNGDVESLVGRYYTRIGHLHGECFYNRMCNSATERRIRETIDYIQDAENLASVT